LRSAADALSGLAGIARAILNEYGGSYMFGAWKENLQAGLLWHVVSGPPKDDDENFVQLNAQTLPSWTWASRRGNHIRYQEVIADWDKYCLQFVQSRQELGTTRIISTTSDGKNLNVRGALRTAIIGESNSHGHY
jgi:hypothetical protein